MPIPGLVSGNRFEPSRDLDAYGAELLQRIAGTVAIMLYEMELRPDGSFECLTFVGLETLIGPVPQGLSSEEAYDAAVHPEDRELYDAIQEHMGVEVLYEARIEGEAQWPLA